VLALAARRRYPGDARARAALAPALAAQQALEVAHAGGRGEAFEDHLGLFGACIAPPLSLLLPLPVSLLYTHSPPSYQVRAPPRWRGCGAPAHPPFCRRVLRPSAPPFSHPKLVQPVRGGGGGGGGGGGAHPPRGFPAAVARLGQSGLTAQRRGGARAQAALNSVPVHGDRIRAKRYLAAERPLHEALVSEVRTRLHAPSLVT
jgi:hypothetical protein